MPPKLPAPRPVSARALKSAMDTLRPQLYGATVLDLYAGTGRFGIAAAEEGAKSVTFVDKSQKLMAAIAAELPKYTPKIVVSDVFQFLDRCEDKFDIVFADPPFPDWNDTYAATFFTKVGQVMAPKAILLVKTPRRVLVSAANTTAKLTKSSDFGESRLLYFVYG